MPNRDGTGPRGKGPKTGRGMGSCGDASDKADVRGRGPGRVFRAGAKDSGGGQKVEN